MAWATPSEARQHWPDAASIDDGVLTTLLDIATDQCAAYAPAVPGDVIRVIDNDDGTFTIYGGTDNGDGTWTLSNVPPARFMLATVYQARENYAAARREGDVIGFGDYAIRARPLTGAVKALLRPPRFSTKVG